MRNARELLVWAGAGVAGALLLVWSAPRLFPLLPVEWQTNRTEARTLALERLRDLGPPVADPYPVIQLRTDVVLERRLQLAAGWADHALLRRSDPARAQVVWDVAVYAPDARPRDWTYRAWVGLDGEVLSLRRAFDGGGGEPLPADEARARAAELLAAQGFDLDAFEPAPEVRPGRPGTATQTVRFRHREAVLGGRHGTDVFFEGAEPRGFGFWVEDFDRAELREVFRQSQLVSMARMVFFYFLLPVVAVPFLRRYHDGQLGVRRGVQFLLLSLAAGVVLLLLNGRSFSEGPAIGLFTREQSTWVISAFLLVFRFFAVAVLGLMSWSVGESFCRELWPQKLASIDALFRGKWANATVARSSLRGYGAGLAMAGVLAALGTLGHDAGAWAVSGLVFEDSGLDSSSPAVSALAGVLAQIVPIYLFVCLLVPSWAIRRLGAAPGLLAAIAVAVVISPLLLVLPLEWGWATWAVVAPVPVLLFRYGDLLSALLAVAVAHLAVWLLPALFAADAALQVQGLGAMLAAAAPLVLSLRHLGEGREFRYAYDDVPAHVRRIAERERQRMELETAREIQSSILPRLPPRLAGVEIAHAYRPANEVGGDYYDVLELADGRVAVAVGDVAGHGVSSGLVMAMARSALAVQVGFDPAVERVIERLNRVVYESARRRLFSTFCYAIVDPYRRRLEYASAGHVYPYRIAPGGAVEPFHAASYPLGVRPRIEVRVRRSTLEAGETLFLYSDGLVEAAGDVDGEGHGGEPFGFERLEASLRRHAGRAPAELRDAVLADVETHAGRRRRDDDLTILVLRLPEG